MLVEPLARRIPRKILPGLIQIAANAGSFRSAEARMAPLVPHFPILTPEEAQALAEASVNNGQIWAASLCRTAFLPELIRTRGDQIDPKTLKALQYQVEQGTWYIGER